MNKPLVIIISGPPCSGKTTLGQRIAAEFHLPLIYKDGIKERLFDTLGWSDRAWSKRLGNATYAILQYFIEIQLQGGVSFIVESNFPPDFGTEIFAKMRAQYDFEPFQIQCRTEGNVLLQRFIERGKSGERHPGHVETSTIDEFKEGLLQGRLDALRIGGTLYELDTTDFAKIDYATLFEAIQQAILMNAKRQARQ
jgi:predicted kinase